MRNFPTSNLFTGVADVGKVVIKKKKKEKEETKYMPKTVTASEAKNRLGAVLRYVQSSQDEVIIESRGCPSVVVMAYTEYERVLTLKEGERRKDALQSLRALREQVRAANQDITTDEEAMQVADQFSQAVVDDLVAEGRMRFEP